MTRPKSASSPTDVVAEYAYDNGELDGTAGMAAWYDCPHCDRQHLALIPLGALFSDVVPICVARFNGRATRPGDLVRLLMPPPEKCYLLPPLDEWEAEEPNRRNTLYPSQNKPKKVKA